MLGNWVEYAVGDGKRSIPMQVTGIFNDTVYLNFEGNEGDVFEEEEENLLGIPLTYELLEKCGFKFSGYSRYFAHQNKIFLTKNLDAYNVYNPDYNKTTRVKYLHELQNAYFILTGKQLEVKL